MEPSSEERGRRDEQSLTQFSVNEEITLHQKQRARPMRNRGPMRMMGMKTLRRG